MDRIFIQICFNKIEKIALLLKFFMIDNEKNKKIKELYEQYADDILIYLYRCTKDYQLACDLLQDTYLNFIRIFFNKENIDIEESKLKIYLFQTAKNLYINYYRRSKRKLFINYNDNIETINQDFHNQNKAINPEDIQIQEFEQKNTEYIINELLDTLHEEEKTLIILRYTLNLKLEEISEIMNKSTSTVSRKIEKIKKKLYEIAKKRKYI